MQIELQFNALLDACGAFRSEIGEAADVVSLGRALEQLSSGELGSCHVHMPVITRRDLIVSFLTDARSRGRHKLAS